MEKVCVFFFKQKTAYEMRISDWSSDVCSSDLFGAIKAINAASLALRGNGQHIVSLDQVIETMRRTGKDKGKRGKVLKVLADNRLVVGGLNMVKRHTKTNPMSVVQGGRAEDAV